MKAIKFVLAGNYDQFIWFLRHNKLSRDDYMYIKEQSDLCGHENIEIIAYGTWWKRDWRLIVHCKAIARQFTEQWNLNKE
jgi:hypothetical protein